MVLGGVRAGKSAYAVARAGAVGGRVAFVATAQTLDAEMAARIARHRAARPAQWETVEAPLCLTDAIAGLEGKVAVVLVDCLNVWVSNLLSHEAALSDEALHRHAHRLTDLIARRPFELVIVSNEVGWGVHPETALGRRFRDALGLVNQAVARVADEVVLMVAGCPLWLKVP